MYLRSLVLGLLRVFLRQTIDGRADPNAIIITITIINGSGLCYLLNTVQATPSKSRAMKGYHTARSWKYHVYSKVRSAPMGNTMYSDILPVLRTTSASTSKHQNHSQFPVSLPLQYTTRFRLSKTTSSKRNIPVQALHHDSINRSIIPRLPTSYSYSYGITYTQAAAYISFPFESSRGAVYGT